MLITVTQTPTLVHRPNSKNEDFQIQGTSKRVNPSKSPLQKYDPKTILSLLMSKRK